jgi:hypothetical protein
LPFFVLLGEDGPDQSGDGGLVGEDLYDVGTVFGVFLKKVDSGLGG